MTPRPFRRREELDERLREENSDDGIIVARVDATKETQLAGRFGVQSYPVLKYFADRGMFTYKGARKLDAIYDFATGGYKSAPAEDIPPPPSAFEAKMKELRQKFESMTEDHEHLRYLLEDFDHIVALRKNAAAVLFAMGVAAGVMLAVVASLLMGTGRAAGPRKKKKEE